MFVKSVIFLKVQLERGAKRINKMALELKRWEGQKIFTSEHIFEL